MSAIILCVCMCVFVCSWHMYNSTKELQCEHLTLNFNSQQQVFNSKPLFHLQVRIQTLQLLQVSAVAHLAGMMLYPVSHNFWCLTVFIIGGTNVGILQLPSSVNNLHLQARMYKYNRAVDNHVITWGIWVQKVRKHAGLTETLTDIRIYKHKRKWK